MQSIFNNLFYNGIGDLQSEKKHQERLSKSKYYCLF